MVGFFKPIGAAAEKTWAEERCRKALRTADSGYANTSSRQSVDNYWKPIDSCGSVFRQTQLKLSTVVQLELGLINLSIGPLGAVDNHKFW